jgi:acylphosphatase
VEYEARQIEVTGWVRNVGWDTVEAVAEGERAKVERFIEEKTVELTCQVSTIRFI